MIEFQDPWWSEFWDGSSRLHRRVMQALAGGALSVINVSSLWCEEDERDFGVGSICVPNGFETSLVPQADPSPGPVVLGYLGRLGNFGSETLNTLWEGLGRVRALPWFFEYVGSDHVMVERAAGQWGLSDHIKPHPVLPQSLAMEKVAASDALVLLTRTMACQDASQVAWCVSPLCEGKAKAHEVRWWGDSQKIDELSWANIARSLIEALEEGLYRARHADRIP